jgi:hypothetical protein
MRRTIKLCVCCGLLSAPLLAQMRTTTAPIQELPSVQAGLSIGFDYDLLYPPTEVPWDYPRGYIGLNIPFQKNFSGLDIARKYAPAIDTIFADTSIIKGGQDYQPKTSGKQNPNSTVRVDVPMLGGVGTFSNTQNFYLNYVNTLGNPNLFFVPESLARGVSLLLRGTVNVPLEMTMGWETMTLGYAYKVNKYFAFAINLHRHMFTFDLDGAVSVDVLGKLKYDPAAATGVGGNSMASAPREFDLDYSSRKVNGTLRGHYEAEAWSPTFGVEAWRFTLTARLGVDARAKGRLLAAYSLPFFLDPRTFKTTVDFGQTDQIAAHLNDFASNATDSIKYVCDDDLRWKMPQAYTLSFDLVPHHLNLSYTKLFGEVSLLLPNIRTEHSTSGVPDSVGQRDTVSLDVGVTVDHVILLSGTWDWVFFNLGIFTIDFRSNNVNHILGDAIPSNLSWMKLGKSPMLPVLNLGSAIGTRLQLVLELDVLPLPALKAGVKYFF